MRACLLVAFVGGLCACAPVFAGQIQIQYVSELAYDQPQVYVYLRDSHDYLPYDTGGGVFPGILDTGAGGHVLPKYLADLLEVPLDPTAQAEVMTLCGYSEYQDVSGPLYVGIGPYGSEDETEYTETGLQRLVVRREDPPSIGLDDFPMVVGTPFLKDHAVYVDWQDIGEGLFQLNSTVRPTGQLAPGPIDLTMHLTLAGETNVDPNAKMPAAWSLPYLDVVVENNHSRQRRSFLLDTGAQITFISTELAQAIGVDLANPVDSLPVVGAGTCDMTIQGYYIDKMVIPTRQNVSLVFLQPLVYVLDVPGIDGGIGSNTLFFFEEQLAADIDLGAGSLGIKLNVPIPPGGDISGDGYCNVGDLQLLVAAWGTTFGQTRFNDGADINADGWVNVGDLQVLVASWGKTTRLPGDCNGDGYVNVSDLQLMVAAWNSWIGPPPSANWNADADCNGDGYVNVGDLQVQVANWGRSAVGG